MKIDSRRPTLTFANTSGTFQSAANLAYRIELLEGDQIVATFTVPQTGEEPGFWSGAGRF